MDARKAAESGGGERDGEEYADLFQSHVLRALSDLTRAERDLLEVDSHLDWEMRAFERSGSFPNLYSHLNYDANTGDHISLDDLDAPATQSGIVHMLRRLRAFCPTGWAAVVRWVEEEAADAEIDVDNDYANMVIGSDEGMAARAAEFETILHDTFTRAEIDDPTAPPPARFVIKRKLEQLTERVASLTPAQTAAKLRAILTDVEESLPEDERTLKKARK